jgi:hypothetical protein
MTPQNKAMRLLLKTNGIDAMPKYLATGSMKGCWRIYGKGDWWDNTELQNKIINMGFRGFDGQPLSKFSGNGGMFSIFARLNPQKDQIEYYNQRRA